jgi:ABC-type polysaccharide/polyol phosphate export permease
LVALVTLIDKLNLKGIFMISFYCIEILTFGSTIIFIVLKWFGWENSIYFYSFIIAMIFLILFAIVYPISKKCGYSWSLQKQKPPKENI